MHLPSSRSGRPSCLLAFARERTDSQVAGQTASELRPASSPSCRRFAAPHIVPTQKPLQLPERRHRRSHAYSRRRLRARCGLPQAETRRIAAPSDASERDGRRSGHQRPILGTMAVLSGPYGCVQRVAMVRWNLCQLRRRFPTLTTRPSVRTTVPVPRVSLPRLCPSLILGGTDPSDTTEPTRRCTETRRGLMASSRAGSNQRPTARANRRDSGRGTTAEACGGGPISIT